MKHRAFIGVSMVVVFVLAVPLWAANPTPQRSPVSPGEAVQAALHGQIIRPEEFGAMGGYRVYQAARWTPVVASEPNPTYYGNGYIGPSSNDASAFWTQVDLPAGAVITAVEFLVYDNDASSEWSCRVIGYQSATPFHVDGPPATVWYGDIGSGISDTPGYIDLVRSFDPGILVRGFQDVDGDGWSGYTSCNLVLNGQQVDGSDTLRFWGAAVIWHRTISPAPASATFGDVPVGSFGFQHIEALAASGITAGCGGGNFCPNGTLTRAQMAVFLAKALGLHWTE